MKRAVQASIGLVIGFGLLWLLFRDTQWGKVVEAVRNVHLGWFIFAQVFLWASFPLRVQRWSYIVRIAQPTSFRHLFSATQIGFLANFTLPARAGEAVRALVLTRFTGIKFTKSFAMVALDRVTDLFGLMTVILISLAAYRPENDVVIPAETFGTPNAIVFSATQYRVGAIGVGVALFAIIASFVFLYTNRSIILRISDFLLGLLSKKLAARVHEMLDHFADGLDVFRSPSAMLKALFFSALTWGASLIFFAGMFEAFHLDYPWYTPFVMMAILNVFIAAPGAPGFVGQFHVPIVITLVMLIAGIDVDLAKAVAIIVHLTQLPPVAILGIHSLATSGMGLLQLNKEGAELKQRAQEDGSG